MYGKYDVKRKKLHFNSAEYTCFENSSVIVLYDGLTNQLFLEMIYNKTFDADWMRAFKGPFQLILYDKKSGDLLITQHLFGNGKNLYFNSNDNVVCFASSLHELKRILKQPFKLNTPMLPHYFYNGFLANSHTLIAGVYKLEAATSYIIKDGIIKKEKLGFNGESSVEIQEDLNSLLATEYQGALNNSIGSLGDFVGNTMAIALSGGFDSNCILFKIKQQFPEINVLAFSVGGYKGIDETETASVISQQYNNVSFHKSLVTPSTLDHLDEIVSILEGSVYERGIFLQFELSKLLHKHNVDYLVCGECADQIFHINTYKNIPEETFLYDYQKTPLQMAVYAVLKKSRMMLDAHGIHGLYPFLVPDMVNVGFKSRDINGTTKEFHKMQCQKMLPESIVELIEKRGGSTDLGALFPEDFNCEREIKNCKYYSKDFMLTQKFDHDEALRDYYLSLLFLESFEKQFCD